MEFSITCADLCPGEYIGLVDCTFVPKKGKATFGLDKFWSSCAGKAQCGLEVSMLARVNVVTKRCSATENTQTPADVIQREGRSEGADALRRRRLLRYKGTSSCLPTPNDA